MEQYINQDSEVSHHVFPANSLWPNNNHLPVLVYKNVFDGKSSQNTVDLEQHFKKNNWSNTWKDSVYQYQHYHSNSHEVLGISEGNIMLNLGGEDGDIVTLCKGDVIVIPAGVAHKNVGASQDFMCVGAYPNGVAYDICTAETNREESDRNISKVALPEMDPVFGNEGPVLQHWKKDESKKVLETLAQF